MCEYCGCQSITEIKRLTEEHDTVVNLISFVQTAHTAGDRDRMAALARQISRVLGPHTAVEENGLFPLMKADFPGQIAALEDEHRLVEKVLGEASVGTPADPDWPDRLVATLDLLRDHILKEQDGVFPAALTSLSGDDWETVALVRSTLDDLRGRAAA
ncbi:hemerythrin domain-containing protein [Actinoplanes sp. NPDC051851]|uniref:hemerythrin domain-containing protein n=1 Tax=Actinoplanes sp. NPDC051851 TaxID=3154753 RepID=UPI003427118E